VVLPASLLQNTLEFLPMMYASLMMAGLRYPFYASCFGAVWIGSRFAYTLAYAVKPSYRTIPFVIGAYRSSRMS
jgi:hypothetical protein